MGDKATAGDGADSAGTPLTKDFLLDLQGIGWEGDLDEMRSSKVDGPNEPE